MLNLLSSTKTAYQTKQEYVYQVLRNAIMRCDLMPGEKIVISDTATQLEVSTIPVREALQLLNSEGLVNYGPHTGAVTAPITKSSIVETFTIKEGLEGVATRVAIEQMEDKHLDHLKNKLKEMDGVIKRQNYEEWGQLNADFHSSVVNIASMPVLKEMHLKILDRWDRIRRFFFSEVLLNRYDQSQEEHHAIVKAMEEKNFSEAEKLAKEHNREALQDYMNYFKEEAK